MAGYRRAKDRMATGLISAGGGGVLLAILLIFFYLVYEILPLFRSASITPSDQRSSLVGVTAPGLYLAIEEQGEYGVVVSSDGGISFIDLASGEPVLQSRLDSPTGARALAVAEDGPQSRIVALGYADGSARVVQHDYRISYPGGNRLISPRLEFPLGEGSFQLLPRGEPIRSLAVRYGEEAVTLAAAAADGSINILRLVGQENFLTGEIEFQEQRLKVPSGDFPLHEIHVGVDQRWLYTLGRSGEYSLRDIQQVSVDGVPRLADRGDLGTGGARLTASNMLLGGISLLVAAADGSLSQYFVVRDPAGERLERIREFDTGGMVITRLLPEHRRKGFAAIGEQPRLQIFHSTAQRRVLDEPLAISSVGLAAFSPRADALIILSSDNQLHRLDVENEHPEVSWSTLWSKVWYESYEAPDYIWQSSASNNDFEPKYSFSPLAFGTLKAAFYAMLLAAPLAICGAIYTAYFMAPALRRKVKPMIELMEALPTVILGFLAGLWLAPFVEANLTGVFTLLLLLPVGVLLFAWCWSRLPLGWSGRVPDGWHAAVLIPVVCLIGYVSFELNDRVELWLFGGDMRSWITLELGISFDQRNALVVGIAMGMAVIPTIFSIAEDAIFSVPRHLSYGSLALGATPWQTMIGVVLPTASPGIFSALMIGMGRAVGETMIVLMATGNTPIMDANIFEGMRTLAANIAVEVPEAEVDSTHYRVLFLAAFVLFMFTFIVNTFAELIRQRLRLRYGSL
jgi:phosphate transport system permease protein